MFSTINRDLTTAVAESFDICACRYAVIPEIFGTEKTVSAVIFLMFLYVKSAFCQSLLLPVFNIADIEAINLNIPITIYSVITSQLLLYSRQTFGASMNGAFKGS